MTRYARKPDRYIRRGVALLMFIMMAVSPVAGQPAPAPVPPQQSPGPTSPPDDRAHRAIEALLIWRLVDELNLTEQQIAQIFPQIKALKELRLGLGRRMVRMRRELRALLRQEPRDEDAIRTKIAQLEALRGEIIRRREAIMGQIRSALTLEQQAKFALIQDRFEAETLRLLQDVRRLIEEGQTRQ